MASTASPYGLRLSKHLGDTYQGHGFAQYPIASGYAADLKTGDIVSLAIGGTIVKFTGTTTASTPILGVFLGVSYTDPTTKYFVQKQQWPSGTVAADAMAYVVDDPFAIFQMQADGSLSQNAVGTNAAVVQGAGNLTLGVSGVSLQASSIALTATLPIRIVGLVNEVGFSVPGDAFTDVLVKFNLHVLTGTTGNAPA